MEADVTKTVEAIKISEGLTKLWEEQLDLSKKDALKKMNEAKNEIMELKSSYEDEEGKMTVKDKFKYENEKQKIFKDAENYGRNKITTA